MPKSIQLVPFLKGKIGTAKKTVKKIEMEEGRDMKTESSGTCLRYLVSSFLP